MTTIALPPHLLHDLLALADPRVCAFCTGRARSQRGRGAHYIRTQMKGPQGPYLVSQWTCEEHAPAICEAGSCSSCRALKAQAWARTQPEHIVQVTFALMTEDPALLLADAAALAYGCTAVAG